jgi:hypothetical protein
MVGYFCILKKTTKENSSPIVENSPNLVALAAKLIIGAVSARLDE